MTDINDVYRQRNNLAIAFCKAALAAGWPAGRGVDDTKEPNDEWRHVVYVDLPSGDQVSWHMAPCAVHLLEGLPEYKGKWEGTFTARHKNWPALINLDLFAYGRYKYDKAKGSMIGCPAGPWRYVGDDPEYAEFLRYKKMINGPYLVKCPPCDCEAPKCKVKHGDER